MSDELLSKDEKRFLKEEIEGEIKQEAKDAEIQRFKEIERKRQRVAARLEQPQEDIFIELPVSSDGITIDGQKFMNNTTYTVTSAQAATMREIMFRSWGHEAEINGKPKTFFQKRNTVISPYGSKNTVPAYGGGRL